MSDTPRDEAIQANPPSEARDDAIQATKPLEGNGAPQVEDVLPADEPAPTPAPPRDVLSIILSIAWMILSFVGSLRVTCILFALSIMLVFLGTLAQVEMGLWTTVDSYFRWFFVWVPFQLLVMFGQKFFGVPAWVEISGSFPFPGGWTLGILMLINLFTAHSLMLVRLLSAPGFRVSMLLKRTGIFILHAGIVVLMIGEFIAAFQIEGIMAIEEGQSSSYTQQVRFHELAVSRHDGEVDHIVAIPASLLSRSAWHEQRIEHPDLPFDLRVEEYMINSMIHEAKKGEPTRATGGDGTRFVVEARPEVSGTDTERDNIPAAYVTLMKKGSDEAIGTYLVSLWFSQALDMPQQLAHDGKNYDLSLRYKRTYKPYRFELLDFRFDRYLGTNTPKNFSSQVRIHDPELGETREVLIRMNEPLYYRGETFYQAGYNEKTERGTRLQVVHNAGWWIPYLACLMVCAGMLVHFSISLVGFLRQHAGLGLELGWHQVSRGLLAFLIAPALLVTSTAMQSMLSGISTAARNEAYFFALIVCGVLMVLGLGAVLYGLIAFAFMPRQSGVHRAAVGAVVLLTLGLLAGAAMAGLQLPPMWTGLLAVISLCYVAGFWLFGHALAGIAEHFGDSKLAQGVRAWRTVVVILALLIQLTTFFSLMTDLEVLHVGGMALSIMFLAAIVAFLVFIYRVRALMGRSSVVLENTSSGWLALGVMILSLIYIAALTLRPVQASDGFHLQAAGKLLVVEHGRVKPLDTLARSQLLIISSRQTYVDEDGKTQPAIRWLFDVMASGLKEGAAHRPSLHVKAFRIDNPQVLAFLGLPARHDHLYSYMELVDKRKELADEVERALGGKKQEEWSSYDRALADLVSDVGPYEEYARYETPHKVFRIENDQVRSLLGLEARSGLRYSYGEFVPRISSLIREGVKARQVDAKERDAYQAKLVELFRSVEIYIELARMVDFKQIRTSPERLGQLLQEARQGPYLVPPLKDGDEWQPFLAALHGWARAGGKQPNPGVEAIGNLAITYAEDMPAKFNQQLEEYQATLQKELPDESWRARLETFFNRVQPFYQCLILYILVFTVTLVAWLVQAFNGWDNRLAYVHRAMFWLVGLIFALHFLAILARMWIQGRPAPVTNLYSSAVFIGLGSVLLGMIVELLFHRGIGNAVASIMGFVTCIIAHHLAAGGDTLEMMQAVLDTNFWLATHVTCVTFGYAATFVAGFFAIAFILLGVFTPLLNRDLFKPLSQIIYGIICFATFLSFTGTVLGGFWADVSWGRFWGWDPKENGALLIVIWNALVLHARWSGWVKQRGVAVLALVGSMITAWSWFGTNQLGVGLHSYGFNETLSVCLRWFWLTHLGLIGIGLIPTHVWRSFGREQPEAAPRRKLA